MAEIHVEKKSGAGMAWLWILLAIVLIAVLAWLFWPAADDESDLAADTTAGDTMTLPPPPTLDANATIAAILANPGQWVGNEFSGTVTLADVNTDRGFWIEQDGQRLFAIVVDDPTLDPVNLSPGQQVGIRGTVRDASYISEIPGGALPFETEQIVRQQPAYLVVDESAIETQPQPVS